MDVKVPIQDFDLNNIVDIKPVWIISPIVSYTIIFGILMCLLIALFLFFNNSKNDKKQKGIKICSIVAIILFLFEAVIKIVVLVHNASL